MTPLRIWWLPAPRVGIDLLAGAGHEEATGFERPDRGETLAGFGVVWEHRSGPGGPLTEAARAVATLREGVHREDGRPGQGDAVLLGAAAFDPLRPGGPAWRGFPAARLVLPRVCFVTRGAASACAVAGAGSRAQALRWRDELLAALRHRGGLRREPAPLGAESEEPHGAFRERAAQAVAAIERGALQKVVLARACRVRATEPIDVARLLRVLRRAERGCARFALHWAGRWWVGATPEHLVRVAGDRVEADALAGSASRGATPDEDAWRARALRESKKEQEEHAWVRAAVGEALEPHVDVLEAPEAPRVRSTAGLHHLHTPFRGRLHTDIGVLDLAARLHPTPAVAGVPTADALAWLRRSEPLVRGAYAGPVGWLDLRGGGDLALALRCALIEGEQARCFAGAGIVAASDPAAELAETELKLRAMLDALREVC